ncbi:Glycosyltransferase involved in cell wall bisynthesis [Methylobacterium sp. UNC378MF]|uniref:glycosyltransferase n=1 Tax=Methylobacterium sp. UNC378MF TaxID=1502748 RepID=UPI00088B96F0|nr:glycosyltransferase [Methylobacterium sp. UNC378MF]SDA27302.1 Glycosyltransferase involved in cell wall bisynthesis [Methylobacterium sp. UNC378MF]
MKVAIVHYWLVGMRGGEKVIEALCNLYPEADIFTHVYAPQAMSPAIAAHRVTTSFIGTLPFAAKRYKSYLPLMPMALEQLDLRGYDLIISSESGPAKGIIPPSDAVHICYCHSPMRYVWNMYHDYRERTGLLTRLMMPPMAHYIRNWDAISAGRVHEFIANSNTVARRIETYYRRQAEVIHPPVDTAAFETVPAGELGDYHLMVGELVRYKRPELAIQAFNRLQKPLVVIGGGEMLRELHSMAGPHIRILGPQPFDVLKHHYARCQALIFPGEEDFGIVPVEAMASGRPVVAYGKGGVTETVLDGITGTFFHEQSVEALIDAVERCRTIGVEPERLVRRAADFGVGRFSEEISRFVDGVLARRRLTAPGVQRAPSRAYLVQ